MKHIFFIFFILFSLHLSAQEAYRLHSDFMFRAKGADSLFHVTKGEVFFDKNTKVLVFKNTFPQKETFVLKDTFLYVYRNEVLAETRKNLIPPEQTMFNYLLSSAFTNFGMDKSGFKPGRIEKQKGLVVTTWEPTGMLGNYFGKILVANKDKRLYSVVIYNKENKMLNRQIFKNYTSVQGMEIPGEILSVTYYGDTLKTYQITNLSNIKINEEGNDPIYNFKTPKK
jgi:hypothetical protein